MSELREILQAQTKAMASAFNAGHVSGYREGFAAGVAEAQKILAGVFPDYKPTSTAQSASVGEKP